MSTGTRVIGFIGLGNMGRPMATNLLKTGYRVAAYDRRAEKLEALERLGAEACSSNKQVAEASDVIITVLPTSGDVRQAILGENGVAESLRPGQVLIEMSSIESETIHALAKEVEPKGCALIDAALSGVEEHAERRELLIMAAGSQDVINAHLDIMRALGRAVVYVGDLGNAKAMKTATAMLATIHTMGAAEVVTWVTKRGLDPQLLLEVAKQAPGTVHESARVIKKLLEGRFKNRPSWSPKDISFGLKSAAELRIATPFTALASQMFMLARALKLDGYEVSGIAYKTFDALSGVHRSPQESRSRA